MVTWSDAIQWSAVALEPHIDAVSAKRKRNAEAGELIEVVFSGIDWIGQAASAAENSLNRVAEDLEEVLSKLGAYLGALARLKDGIGEVEYLVMEARQYAEHNNLKITDFGLVVDWAVVDSLNPSKVIDGTSPKVSEMLPPYRHALIFTCQLMVRKATKHADAVCEAFSQEVQAIVDGKIASESLDDINPGIPNFPENMSTEEVAEWWDSMTAAEQAEMINAHYYDLGNIDGLPGWVRDLSNRRRFHGELMQNPDDPTLRAVAKSLGYDEVNGTMVIPDELSLSSSAGKEVALRLELDHGWGIDHSAPDPHSSRQLLVYDVIEGVDGKPTPVAAVSVGDVDTAQNVSAFVPGMGSSVEGSLESYTDTAARLQQKAFDDRLESTAVVAWIGYDAPAGFPEGVPEVASIERAVDGGDRFRGFMEGIHDSRVASGRPDPRLTVVGHSYGSTTSSYAVAHAKPGVIDGVMLYGSPGMIAHSGGDLNVTVDESGERDLRTMQYGNDLIEWLNSGARGLATPINVAGPFDITGALGPAPNTDSYFDDVTPRASKWYQLDSGTLNPVDAHSAYHSVEGDEPSEVTDKALEQTGALISGS